MLLGSLCGRPLVHGIWGWIAGWIYDIWLDFRHTRVAAFQICEPDRMQFSCVKPFALRRSTRYGLGIDVDPGKWQVIERDMQWASVRAIEDVTVVSADGEWSCVVTDADCNPHDWRISSLQIRRPWWEFAVSRTLAAEKIVDGGPDVLFVNRG
jgi:hypothetical protein